MQAVSCAHDYGRKSAAADNSCVLSAGGAPSGVAVFLGRVLRAVDLDGRADEVAAVVGGHFAAVQHVVGDVRGRLARVKLRADLVRGLDRVAGRQVVADALRLQQGQELSVVGVG